MPIYSCYYCNFDTKNKYDYSRHLKTQKHKYRTQHFEDLGDGNVIYQKNALKEQKRPKMTQNDPKMTQNDPKMNQNEPKMNQQNRQNMDKNVKKKFNCSYCNKLFSTKAHKRRHEIHRCKSKNNYEYRLRKVEKEKKQLYKHLEVLIEKAGNTTHITNNIQINGFGHEDTSYITNKMLDKLVVYPGTMIPNLVALTHFHKDHPENKNLMITNKKDKYVKVFTGGKWTLQDKDNIIDNIICHKYDILEEHFDEKCKNNLENYQKKRFNQYREEFVDDNNKIINDLKENIKLTIINNTDN